MRKLGVIMVGITFMVGSLGSYCYGIEKDDNGIPKSTKEKWKDDKVKKINEEANKKRNEIDEDSKQRGTEIKRTGMTKTVAGEGPAEKKKKVDEWEKKKIKEVEDTSKDPKLGGDHIYKGKGK
jgi:hypothetical protein